MELRGTTISTSRSIFPASTVGAALQPSHVWDKPSNRQFGAANLDPTQLTLSAYTQALIPNLGRAEQSYC